MTSLKTQNLGLIVDFGGVLTTPILEAITDFETREGLTAGTYFQLMRHTVAGVELHQALERGDISQSDWNQAAGKALGVSPDNLMGRTLADLCPATNVINAVQVLRAAGVKVGVLTNSVGTSPYDPYAGYELETRYDALVISERERLRKPDPRIFKMMLARLGVPATSCVFVDDMPDNLEPARQLGMTTILAVSGKQIVYDLQGLYDTFLGQP